MTRRACNLLIWGLLGVMAVWASDPAHAAPRVVVSIKPIHSLVTGVMAGVGTPHLLVKGAASPHTYALKPSDARALQEADLIFWVGDEMEMFLEKPLRSIPKKAQIVALMKTKGLTLRKAREGGVWESHEEEHQKSDRHEKHEDDHGRKAHKEEAHAHGEIDMHLWLDPMNAKAMVHVIVHALRHVDRANAAKYKANGEKLDKELDALDKELAAKLGPVKRVPFIVFHDAYQYFEKRYGLNGVGTITVSPDRKPGAKRLSEIRAKIRSRQAACVFAEPQFRPALVKSVVEGTEAQTGLLDPLGADLPAGSGMYFRLMRGLESSLSKCLSSKPRS